MGELLVSRLSANRDADSKYGKMPIIYVVASLDEVYINNRQQAQKIYSSHACLNLSISGE